MSRQPYRRPSPPDWWEPFLTALARYPVLTYAARQAGVTTNLVNTTERRNPIFSALMQEAREQGLDELELSLYRAAEGELPKANVIAGIFLLKHRRPRTYHEEYVKRQAEMDMRPEPSQIEHQVIPLDYRETVRALAPAADEEDPEPEPDGRTSRTPISRAGSAPMYEPHPGGNLVTNEAYALRTLERELLGTTDLGLTRSQARRQAQKESAP